MHGDATIQPTAPAQPAAEAPIDRLRRRLGEVINGKGQLDAVASGDLRLRTRAVREVALTPTNHRSAGHAPTAAAVTGDAAAAAQAHRPGAAPHAEHWAYEGKTGPQSWGRLKAEFATCGGGQRQSPIDIRDGIGLELEPLQFDYGSGSFAVIDNGHTVQVNVPPGNSLEVMGRKYELLQFHFHRPSEEHIDGRRFELSVHLVHKDAQGRLAVLAVLLERGAAQPLLQTVWNHLPLEKGEEVPVRAQIDLSQLLPEDRRYFAYMGSLTTPPCSEGVLWMVMQQPVPLSQRQIDIFARLYPMSARPIQQAAGRLIKQSN
ncbi:MAG: carbonic anhydrase family protein [Rubrivivax sp.]